ncbi:hypothetical protein [Glutamicibacter arilaitensis]|uniref:hypothetical protein n=1 Tax=Glutamicibacter arilaitensis TaxID=256701 RepID=UPI00384D5C2E
MPETGDELIYHVGEYSLSSRVRIVEVDRRKKTPRYIVEFLGGDKPGGVQENVPGGRLRAPWADVTEYDALMANWEGINQAQLTEIEESAVDSVFEMLIPEEIAQWQWSPVHYATRIHDKGALQALIGITVEDLLTQTEGIEVEGDVIEVPDWRVVGASPA